MRFVICGTMIPVEVEKVLPGASPATGKFIRNMEKAMVRSGYEVVENSYIAIPGAKEAFDYIGIEPNGVIFKDKTIIKSILQYQIRVMNNLKAGDVIIFYDIVYFHIGLVDRLKKAGYKVLLILSDFTDSYSETTNFIRWLISRIIKCEFKKFDYGLVLSENAKKYFNKRAKVLTILGGIDYSAFKDIKYYRKDEVVRVMYAGSFTRVQGLDILLDAIFNIPADTDIKIEFYISGKGELLQLVKEAARKDARIKYLGYMDEADYYQMIEKMDVFINPRNMSYLQNQNNFPSKVLEYLATGKTVISTKFPGYEQFGGNFVFYDGKTNELSRAILDTAKGIVHSTIDGTALFGKNRKKAEEYDWNFQVRKIKEILR